MLIFPAIDIRNGKCVRLRQGAYEEETIYSESPKSVAESFLDQGFRNLHLVDLDGARAGAVRNWRALQSVLAVKGARVQFGGGVRTRQDVKRLLSLGVSRVIVGSVAVKSPELISEWIDEFGSDRIAVAVDVKDGKVASGGWLKLESRSPQEVIQELMKRQARTVICTDITRDGMLAGPNTAMYNDLLSEFPEIQLIASGGVSSIEDIEGLAKTSIAGVIVGKALYEGKIRLEDLKRCTV